MGRGKSGAKNGGGGGTPSGLTQQQLMAMSEDEQIDAINRILSDPNIVVPDYMDNSATSKVMYALGMDQKPTVVDDSAFDALPGREMYRTVYEDGAMPPPSSAAIMDQIKNSDYTQMSGAGGSAYGRALYFARNFTDSTDYGVWGRNALVTRAKINPNANMISDSKMDSLFYNSKYARNYNSTDGKALCAIANGYDGWYASRSVGYVMMVNRGATTMSGTNKSIYTSGSRRRARSWQSAPDA